MNDPRFDRLVDDEMTEEERRQLLAGLDDEPGGWRRCALAFLESQCWKQTLGAMQQRSRRTPCADIESLASPGSHLRWLNHAGTLMAMAASFLVMFWIGSRIYETHRGQSVTPAGDVGQFANATRAQPSPLETRRPEHGLAGVGPKTPPAADPWRVVTVSSPAGAANSASSLRVPAVERENVDPQWLQSLPSAIPDDVMQAFNRTGHQIEQQRELIPIPLQDGRQLVMPVDRVKVHYVGNGPY